MKLEDIFKDALAKFEKGVQEHGEFDPETEKRDLLAEVDEEILDAINYLAMWLIQKRTKSQWDKDIEKYAILGNKCHLWKKDVPDMNRKELVAFIGYLDELCTIRLKHLQS